MYKKHEVKPNIETDNVLLKISTSLVTVSKVGDTYISKYSYCKLWYSIVCLVKDSEIVSEHHYSFIVGENLILL